MKKLLVIGGIVVGIGIVGVIVLGFFLGSIVTKGVNKFGPEITQTKFVLESASISPFSGSGTLQGLVIGNPKGWSENNLCSLGAVHVALEPLSIFGDHIVINAIVIEAPEFNYETKLVASNVNDLLKNIEQSMGARKPGAAPTTQDGKPAKFEVKHFKLNNGKVRVGVGAAAMTLPMPPIELRDLGTKEGGITANQLAFAVMKSVTASVVAATTQAVGKLGTTGGAAAAESVKQVGDAIKGIFSGEKKKSP